MKFFLYLFVIFKLFDYPVLCGKSGKTKITSPPAPKEILPPK